MEAGYAMAHTRDWKKEFLEQNVLKIYKPGTPYTAIVDFRAAKNSTSKWPSVTLIRGNKLVISCDQMKCMCASAWDIAVQWAREGVYDEKDFAR